MSYVIKHRTFGYYCDREDLFMLRGQGGRLTCAGFTSPDVSSKIPKPAKRFDTVEEAARTETNLGLVGNNPSLSVVKVKPRAPKIVEPEPEVIDGVDVDVYGALE